MVRTKQRELILAVTRQACSHPTAEELFRELRLEMPSISLATVYRNLNLLAEHGLIRKLTMSGADRFEGNMQPHDHVVCTKCGRVFDLKLPSEVLSDLTAASGMTITGYSLIASGICPHCEQLKQ